MTFSGSYLFICLRFARAKSHVALGFLFLTAPEKWTGNEPSAVTSLFQMIWHNTAASVSLFLHVFFGGGEWEGGRESALEMIAITRRKIALSSIDTGALWRFVIGKAAVKIE